MGVSSFLQQKYVQTLRQVHWPHFSVLLTDFFSWSKALVFLEEENFNKSPKLHQWQFLKPRLSNKSRSIKIHHLVGSFNPSEKY